MDHPVRRGYDTTIMCDGCPYCPDVPDYVSEDPEDIYFLHEPYIFASPPRSEYSIPYYELSANESDSYEPPIPSSKTNSINDF